MSMRLREMIKLIREAKTAAEERDIVAKECADIRTSFRKEENDLRARNICKLIYVNLLGYATHFAQMDCLKLIVQNSYSDKRVGYLGLMMLLDERQEVLMLVTNSLKKYALFIQAYKRALKFPPLLNSTFLPSQPANPPFSISICTATCTTSINTSLVWLLLRLETLLALNWLATWLLTLKSSSIALTPTFARRYASAVD